MALDVHHTLSILILCLSLVLTFLLPTTYLGRGGGPPAKVGQPNEIAITLQPGVQTDLSFVHFSHTGLLSVLCNASDPSLHPQLLLHWFASALQREGLEVETLSFPTGTVLHSVLRAGSGTTGLASLAHITPLPRGVMDLGVSGCADSFWEEDPATPHGSLLLLSLARTLGRAPWRAVDVAFVFYAEAGEGEGGGREGEAGPLGQLGAYTTFHNFTPTANTAAADSPATVILPSAQSSQALSHWARLVVGYDPWVEGVVGEGGGGDGRGGELGRAWRAWDFFRYTQLLLNPGHYYQQHQKQQQQQQQQQRQHQQHRQQYHRPLRHPIPPLLAAIVFTLPASPTLPPPSQWGILTQGPNGVQEDLDLFSTLLLAIPRPLRLVDVMGGGGGGGRKGGGANTNFPLFPPFLSTPPVKKLLTAAWSITMGPSGPHGDLLYHGIPAVTLVPRWSSSSTSSTSSGTDSGGKKKGASGSSSDTLEALGAWLYTVTRGLNALDENLHAGPRNYVLLQGGAAGAHYIPLPEYIIPIALAHLPVLLLLLRPFDGKGGSATAAAAAAATTPLSAILSPWDLCVGGYQWLASALIVGGVPYLLLQNPAAGEMLHLIMVGVGGGLFPHSWHSSSISSVPTVECSGNGARYLSWCVFVGVWEWVCGGVFFCLSPPFSLPPPHKGGAEAAVAVASARVPPPLAFPLALQAAIFLPLVYFDAPLLWVESTLVMWLLVGGGVLGGKGGGSRLRTILWGLTSPLAGMALMRVLYGGGGGGGGGEGVSAFHPLCAMAGTVERMAALHATFASLHVPLLLFMVIPCHVALVWAV